MKKTASLQARFSRFMISLLFVLTIALSVSWSEEALAATTKTPSKVTLSSISAPAYNKVTIKWKKASNVTSYNVYYKESGASKWTKIANESSSKTSYTHTSSTKYKLTPGKTYYYTVCGYNSKIKKSGSYNKTGLKVVIPGNPSKVTITSVKADAYNKVTVKWKKASNVTSYNVYYKESGASKWTKIANESSSKTSYTHTSSTKYKLTPGKTYYYTVCGYNSKIKKSGSYNKTGLKVVIPGKPSKVTVTSVKADSYNKVTVKWKKVSNASSYRIYYKVSGADKWIMLADVSGSKTSYTHKSSSKYKLTPGKKYYYTVKAYNKTSKTWGSYDKTGKNVTIPKAPTATPKPTEKPKPTEAPKPEPTKAPKPTEKPEQTPEVTPTPENPDDDIVDMIPCTEHKWVEKDVEIEHPEEGHWEDKVVKEAWVESIEHPEVTHTEIVVIKEATKTSDFKVVGQEWQDVVVTEAWTEQVEHKEEGHYETVVVTEAWTENKPIYEKQMVGGKVICNTCLQEMSNGNEHAERDVLLFYQGLIKLEDMCGGYHMVGGEIVDVQVGTETIEHPAVTEERWVVDKKAYTETIEHPAVTERKLVDVWDWVVTETPAVTEEKVIVDKEAWTETIEHPAVTEKVWVVDKEAWTEKVIKVVCEICGIDQEEAEKNDTTTPENTDTPTITNKPLVDAFCAYIKTLKVSKKDTFGDAVSYTLNQERYLRVFLQDGDVPIDNNASERAIRGFCVGKNL